MGRAAVRSAIAAYLAPSNSNIAGLGNVYAHHMPRFHPDPRHPPQCPPPRPPRRPPRPPRPPRPRWCAPPRAPPPAAAAAAAAALRRFCCCPAVSTPTYPRPSLPAHRGPHTHTLPTEKVSIWVGVDERREGRGKGTTLPGPSPGPSESAGAPAAAPPAPPGTPPPPAPPASPRPAPAPPAPCDV